MKMRKIILFTLIALSAGANLVRAEENPAAGYVAARDQNAPLFDAAKSGNVKELRAALKSRSVNAQDEKGYTALIYAAYYGNEEAVNLLLKQGADPCVRDKRGNTATLGAIFKGHLGIARTLMKSSCAVTAKNDAGQTPLMFASLFGRISILKDLLAKGAKPEETDQLGNSAISLAETQGNEEALKVLNSKK